MKGIVKMDRNGNPSLVLPGVEMKLTGPIADKFKGLPQLFADQIEVDCMLFSYMQNAPSFSMELRIKDDSMAYAEKEKAPEAATPGANLKGSNETIVSNVTPDAETVKGKESV